jgi:pimeloyl-ACP methyl ester carboxylesterase
MTDNHVNWSVDGRSFLKTTAIAAILLQLLWPASATQPLQGSQKMTNSMIQGAQGQLAAVQLGGGNGLPLMFIHADPGRASQWDDVMTAMAKDHAVAAYDARGAGDSSPAADGDYSYEGRAADLGLVADCLKFKTFFIVAHSAGAAVALTYAAQHSDRVVGIFMVDPVTDPRALPARVRDGFVKDMAGPKSLEVFTAYVGSIAGKNEAVRKRVLSDAEKIEPAARAGIAKAAGDWNPEITLAAYKGPIFILSTPATDNAGAFYRLRPDIPHSVVQTEGHWLQLDHPKDVAEAIKTFVAKVESGP